MLLANIYNKPTFRVTNNFRKIISLLLPYLLSGLIVLSCYLVANYRHSRAHWLGGSPDEAWSYLEMRTLNTGDVLCFIKTKSNYFYYTVILIYAFTMVSVLAVYALALKRIAHEGETDRMAAEQMVVKLKKMALTFFTIGACWLFLIFAMKVPHIMFDWLFTIFKFLQSVVLLWVACGHELIKLWRSRTRTRIYKACLRIFDKYLRQPIYNLLQVKESDLGRNVVMLDSPDTSSTRSSKASSLTVVTRDSL